MERINEVIIKLSEDEVQSIVLEHLRSQDKFLFGTTEVEFLIKMESPDYLDGREKHVFKGMTIRVSSNESECTYIPDSKYIRDKKEAVADLQYRRDMSAGALGHP